MAGNGDITSLLAAVRRGDTRAEAELVSLVYDELRVLARRCMRRERPDHTLQPTALVHEAYLRLLRQHSGELHDRVHFFALAATVMRRILVDYARRRAAAKRPGNKRVDLNDALAASSPQWDQILALDEALTQLAAWNERQARVVELMYFADMTENEVSEVLGFGVRTIKRDWSAARAWLQRQLGRSGS